MRIILTDDVQLDAGSGHRAGAAIDLPLQAAQALIDANRARRPRRGERSDDLGRLTDALQARDAGARDQKGDADEPSDETPDETPDEPPEPDTPEPADWSAIDWQAIDGVAGGTEAEIVEWLEGSDFVTYAGLAASDLTDVPGIGDAKRDAAHRVIVEEATRGDQ